MTLIEVLAVLAITGLVFALLGQGMRHGMDSQQRQIRVLAEYADHSATDSTLRDLIERMDPGLTHAAPADFVGGPHAMEFTTELPEGAGAASAREANVRLEVDPDHRLVLRWQPRRGLSNSPSVPVTSPILAGVERLEIRYWQPEQAGGTWISAWLDPILPKLIRLRIVPVAGEGAPMPDIVVAPARHRWRL